MALNSNETTDDGPNVLSRVLAMASLMLAGEAIFGLPFHVSRYFRPAFVDVFDVTQTQLGLMGSLYGGVATISYLLGGRLADRFSARGLLSFALVITALSGFYMLTIPSPTGLLGLYAFWGVSTILPFWSALIRATRDWGGTDQQGRAFGMLDAGRGFLAAVLATFALVLFTWTLPSSNAELSLEEKTWAIQSTIGTYIAACLFAAVMVMLCLPSTSRKTAEKVAVGSDDSGSGDSDSCWWMVLRMPAVWFQAIVIVGAYCTFKGIDYYSQYAKDIWGWSDVEASTLSTLSTWMRPIATVLAGVIADRFRPSRTVIAAFAVVALASLSMVLMSPSPMSAGGTAIAGGSPVWLLWTTILFGCLGIFALRGIYFALLEESQVPMRVTGTAVGVVSFIGYTPEIFMPVLGGMLIDHWDGGIQGYQVFFGVLVFACLVGIIAAWRLLRLVPKNKQDPPVGRAA